MKLGKFSSKVLTLAAAVGIASGAAHASVIDQYLKNGQNVLEDDSNEYIFRPDGSGGYTITTSGDIADGDVLVQILDFSIINGTNIDSDGNELTGIAVNKITNINNERLLDTDGAAGPIPPYTAIDFEQVSATPADWLALTGIDISTMGAGLGFDATKTFGLLFADGANDLDVFTQDLAAAIPNVVDGELVFALGLEAAKDFVSVVGVPKDIGVFAPSGAETPGVTTYGGFSYGLTVQYEDIDGIVLANPNPAISDFPGTGTNLVTDRLTVAAVIDDTQASFYAEVPEPATLAMLGFGLLGLGYGQRRKANKNA